MRRAVTSKARAARPSRRANQDRRGERVQLTAFVADRRLSAGELKRVTRALAAEGIAPLRPTRLVLTRHDAHTVAEGNKKPVEAAILQETSPPHSREGDQSSDLSEALAAARQRGDALKQDLLADPEMLNTAAIAERLGMSEEGIRLKRKRHEIIGIEFAKRGIRYPSWQVVWDRQLVPGIARLFAVLGDDPWRVFRFLQQRHAELGGGLAIDALRRGRVDAVVSAAENVATAAFS